jgi:hypothetical protein
MEPPKFCAPRKYIRVTRQGQRIKERMVEPKTVADMEDVKTLETNSLRPMRVEEETTIMAQGEIGKRSENKNGNTNPDVEKHAKPEGRKEQQ